MGDFNHVRYFYRSVIVTPARCTHRRATLGDPSSGPSSFSLTGATKRCTNVLFGISSFTTGVVFSFQSSVVHVDITVPVYSRNRR